MSAGEDTGRRLARRQAVDEAYQALEKYQIDYRRIVFVPARLGSHLYGPPQVVAVKEIKLSAMHDASDLKRAFTKELVVWSRLEGHPGVAKFLGFCANFGRSEAWLISPWEPYGNVSEFIRGRQLEVPEKLSLVYDTIDALKFLHHLDPPVCHGDIKSPNILVNSQFRAVLCDFGLARLYEDNGFGRLETSTGFKGSIRWCSPELLDGQPRTPSSDVYAWAWLVWEIMTGELPHEGAGADYVIIRKIFESPRPQVNGESRLADCLQVWELITRCWALEPLQRPTSTMCQTTIAYLPHCPPSYEAANSHTRSATLLENLGDLESWKGNRKEGFAYLEQALHLYEEEGNERGIASVLRKQAAVSYQDSDHSKTLTAASAALERFRSLNDATGMADALYWMACSYLLGYTEEDKALPHLQQSLEIFRAQGNSVGVVQCLERLGELHRRKGGFGEASLALEEAVDIASRCGYRLGEARALTVLGVTLWTSENLDQVISTIQRSLDIARNIGWDHGVSTALCRLGDAKLEQGIPLEAEELLLESVHVARRSEAGWRLAQALFHLGRCFRAQNKLPEAILALEESCLTHQHLAHSYNSDLGEAALLLAEAKVAHGDLEGAFVWYDKAIAEHRKGGDNAEISRCFTVKGTTLVRVGRCDEGALHFEASLVLNRELGYHGNVAWNTRKLVAIPKTTIKWEIRRQARLAFIKTHSDRGQHLLCDLKKLQLRVPQLTTPNLRLAV